MKFVGKRNKDLTNAFGFWNFHRQLHMFMQTNNMLFHEIEEVMRLLNHFYYYGMDISKDHELIQGEFFKTKYPRPIPERFAVICPHCKKDMYSDIQIEGVHPTDLR